MVSPDGIEVGAGDLAAGMRRAARMLAGSGLESGDTVAVVLSNRREFIEVYGAAIWSGLVFVAVNWHLLPDEVSYILEDSGAKAIVTEPRFARPTAVAADRAGIDATARFAVEPCEFFQNLPRPEGSVEPIAPLPLPERAGQIMFYTSGTTGRPKGVRKRFRMEASEELTLTSGIGPIRRATPPDQGDPGVYLASGPFYHALPIAGAVSALDRGAMVVFMDRWTPDGFLDLVERYGVTDATLVPTMFHRLLSLPEEVRRGADVSSLRFVNHAGAPCPVEVKRQMIEWWGPIISEGYSSTEGAGTSVTSEEWLARPGTVGRPSPGVELRILDDDGKECQPGQPGLVYMTPSLWEFEYHGDDDKTRSTRKAGMFTVGDIGYLDEDGYLFLCGRQADTIISGGVNIYPAEVEAVLLQHPAVRDVAVIGVPDDEWGEQVRAVVELAAGSEGAALAPELVEFCRQRIAHYKCPKAVDFVDSLERDPNGKLRKGAIRQRYWAGRARGI